jgi:hypothetical protein
MMHKYWIHYALSFPAKPEEQVHGGMAVMRQLPITDPAEMLMDIRQAVANQIAMDMKLPPKTEMNLAILGFSKFEQMVLIANEKRILT